jgi:hypothetical protein
MPTDQNLKIMNAQHQLISEALSAVINQELREHPDIPPQVAVIALADKVAVNAKALGMPLDLLLDRVTRAYHEN